MEWEVGVGMGCGEASERERKKGEGRRSARGVDCKQRQEEPTGEEKRRGAIKA